MMKPTPRIGLIVPASNTAAEVHSNQAVLWAALRRLEITKPIAGLGRLLHPARA